MRSKDKAAVLSNQYPKIRVVHGDLDSYDILEEEVGKADIVFRGFSSTFKLQIHIVQD